MCIASNKICIISHHTSSSSSSYNSDTLITQQRQQYLLLLEGSIPPAALLPLSLKSLPLIPIAVWGPLTGGIDAILILRAIGRCGLKPNLITDQSICSGHMFWL